MSNGNGQGPIPRTLQRMIKKSLQSHRLTVYSGLETALSGTQTDSNQRLM
jgi:hypothetical protein